MKINIRKRDDIEEIEITVECKSIDEKPQERARLVMLDMFVFCYAYAAASGLKMDNSFSASYSRPWLV